MEKVRRRRINFDQIQSAIKQLVNDASNDVRSQYGHLLSTGAVNQSLLQRRVASELMVRLATSGTQGQELDVRLVCLFTCWWTVVVLRGTSIHLGFDQTSNSAIRFADVEKPTYRTKHEVDGITRYGDMAI